MKIGKLVVTPKGLRALAKAIEILNGNCATLEVHQVDDTHGEVKLCLTPEAGWIDISKGWLE